VYRAERAREEALHTAVVGICIKCVPQGFVCGKLDPSVVLWEAVGPVRDRAIWMLVSWSELVFFFFW
jgi:hypothetical protein